jgi:protein-disulfide isomerase
VSTKQLDRIAARLDAIDGRLDRIEKGRAGAGARPVQARPEGPDPSARYRIPVAGDAHRGATHAKVTLVEAFEFACPHCATVGPTVDQLLADYGKDLKVVAKHFVVHPQIATAPALAACAAAKQGKFAELKHALFTQAWPVENGQPRLDGEALAPAALEKLAGELGLRADAFRADMNGEDCKHAIERNRAEMIAAGARGTPSFYINGRPYLGPRTVDGFRRVIDEEIKVADAAVASGIAIEGYYDHLMKNAKPVPN